MSFAHKDTACRRLRATGLTQSDALAILDLFTKWTRESGPEWTIKRLKSLKIAYIEFLAGSQDPFSKTDWVAHKRLRPKGPFGRLFMMKNPQKAISALMSYTGYKAKRVTKSQMDKFVSAVTSDMTADSTHFLEKLRSSPIWQVSLDLWLKQHKPRNPKYLPISSWINRKVRVPYVDMKWDRNLREDIPVVRTMENSMDAFVQSCTVPWLVDYYNQREGSEDPMPADLAQAIVAGIQMGETPLDEDIVGKIGFIQEPGYKLRTVANPFPVWQALLSRMGRTIYNALGDIPEDCTFDQDKSIKNIQTFMAQNPGEQMMSIDLSSATDRFPLDLQLDVAHQICEPDDIVLFEHVARGRWALPDGSFIKWNVGQPLGVYPSFGLFALTHHMLVRQVNPKAYVLLGDDIWIDAESGKKLRELYQGIGLPISEDKSITSSKLAEFGGRLITKDKVYVQPKWKEISDRSFIDLARNLGPKSLGMFTSRQRKILKVLQYVPRDIHPWGLNWNPDGLPYQDRVKIGELMFQVTEPTLDRTSQSELESLKLSLQLEEFMEFKTRLDVPTLKNDQCDRDFEESLLEGLGIYTAEFVEKLSSNWKVRMNQTVEGDPRGPSTLVVAERKLANLPDVHKLINKSNRRTRNR